MRIHTNTPRPNLIRSSLRLYSNSAYKPLVFFFLFRIKPFAIVYNHRIKVLPSEIDYQTPRASLTDTVWADWLHCGIRLVDLASSAL